MGTGTIYLSNTCQIFLLLSTVQYCFSISDSSSCVWCILLGFEALAHYLSVLEEGWIFNGQIVEHQVEWGWIERALSLKQRTIEDEALNLNQFNARAVGNERAEVVKAVRLSISFSLLACGASSLTHLLSERSALDQRQQFNECAVWKIKSWVAKRHTTCCTFPLRAAAMKAVLEALYLKE